MADTTPQAAQTTPVPDAQQGSATMQQDSSQTQTTPAGASPQPASSDNGAVQSSQSAIPPVQQSIDVTADKTQPVPTENAQAKGDIPQKPMAQYQQPAATAAMHPAVQKASLLNEIATTLAGGPRYSTTIDPNTGVTTRTKVPLSTKQLGMAIALEALSGGITGLAQKGPNHVAQAGAAGYQQGQQESQQVQAANQANEDQAKNDYATKAMIAHTNFQTYQNAVTLGKLEYDANHEQDVAHAPMIDALRNQGGLLDEGLRGNVADLAKKYNVGQDLFIRQNTVPRLDPNTGQQAKDPETGRLLWDGEYALIDPKAKISVPDETLKYLADHHVQGFYRMDENGKSVPINLPTNTQMRAVVAANAMSAASAIQVGDHAMTGQLAQLGKDGDKYVEEFHKNYEDAHNTVDPSALKVFSRYAAVPLDQLQATMIKDKVDPDTRGQIMSLIPTGAIEQSKLDAADKAAASKATEATKNLVVSGTNYNDVLANPKAYSVEQQQAAENMKKTVADEKAQQERMAAHIATAAAGPRAKNAEIGRVEGRVAEGLPKEAGKGTGGEQPTAELQDAANPANSDANGINMKYYNTLAKTSPQRALAIKAVAEGRNTMSAYALAKEYGGDFMGDVDAYDNNYDQQKTTAYDKLRTSYATGKDKGEIEGINTTLTHLGLAASHATATALNMSPKLSKEAAIWSADKSRVVEGVNSAYTSGVLHKDERDNLMQGLESPLPEVVKGALQEYGKLVVGAKVEAKYNTFQNAKPSNAIPDYPLINPQAAQAYQSLMGTPIDPKYLGGKQSGTNINNQPNQTDQHAAARSAGVPVGGTAARDTKGNIVGYKDAQGGYHSLTQ